MRRFYRYQYSFFLLFIVISPVEQLLWRFRIMIYSDLNRYSGHSTMCYRYISMYYGWIIVFCACIKKNFNGIDMNYECIRMNYDCISIYYRCIRINYESTGMFCAHAIIQNGFLKKHCAPQILFYRPEISNSPGFIVGDNNHNCIILELWLMLHVRKPYKSVVIHY